MIEAAELLTVLAPLYEPELPVSRWPAPGYWLLMLMTLLLLGIISWLSWRRWQCFKPRRQAQAELAILQTQASTTAAELNLLLKRLLKAYAPQHPMLSAKPQQWQTYWQQQLPASLTLPQLDTLLYQASAQQNPEAIAQFKQAVAYLIPRLDPKRCQTEQDSAVMLNGVTDA